jgi:hypothetical protein
MAINHIKAPALFGAEALTPVGNPPNPGGGDRVQLSERDGFVALDGRIETELGSSTRRSERRTSSGSMSYLLRSPRPRLRSAARIASAFPTLPATSRARCISTNANAQTAVLCCPRDCKAPRRHAIGRRINPSAQPRPALNTANISSSSALSGSALSPSNSRHFSAVMGGANRKPWPTGHPRRRKISTC